MADDGMLLNFDVGSSEPLLAKTTFRGGRWKDRKALQNRDRRQKTGVSSTSTANPNHTPIERKIFKQSTHENGTKEDYIGPSTTSSSEDRAAKRQRVEKEYRLVTGRNAHSGAVMSGKLPAGSINIGSRKRDASGTSGKPLQVISSLFTYNPSTRTTFDDPAKEAEPVKPSNAPLSDELSTFTSLGMSRRLAAHLSTKLEMKAPTAIQKAAVPQLIKDESDAFIQAETGSGKTLAYLLPIVERIMAESAAREVASPDNKQAWVHRDSGLFAIILAPTRELCKQISVVLEKLLRCAPWIVGTTVIGGESKKSEKARLRKGVNILIATPGRLADHLDNTEVLKVNTVRWLVLDEGDRLMELGFEEEIKNIVQKIGRTKLTGDSAGPSKANGGLPHRRVTVLCSATMQMTVQKLGEISLKDAVHIKADPSDEDPTRENKDGSSTGDAVFSAPAQLKQEYAIVPAKQRLVTLHAFMKHAFARRGTVMKAIVFISCADSVDFHYALFSRPSTTTTTTTTPSETNPDKNEEEIPNTTNPPPTPSKQPDLTKDTTSPSPLLSTPQNPDIHIHKLHGSLPQPIRSATLEAFASNPHPSLLLCTDVASRGLDLPSVDLVIEYDPPFASADHLHRVGRTARAGRPGRALIFLLPGCEEGYIPILSSTLSHSQRQVLTPHDASTLLRRGFGGVGTAEWEARATEWQLETERWVLDSPKYLEMARRAFQSHVRAYATHVAAERTVFDIKELHLGHLAKAFGLRDRPGEMRVPGLRPGKSGSKGEKTRAVLKGKHGKEKGSKSGRASDGGAGDEALVEGERERKTRKKEREASSSGGGGGALGPGGVAWAEEDVAARMRRKMREHMSAASEFNIG